MMTSSALMMTAPGLALFYCGVAVMPQATMEPLDFTNRTRLLNYRSTAVLAG